MQDTLVSEVKRVVSHCMARSWGSYIHWEILAVGSFLLLHPSKTYPHPLI